MGLLVQGGDKYDPLSRLLLHNKTRFLQEDDLDTRLQVLYLTWVLSRGAFSPLIRFLSSQHQTPHPFIPCDSRILPCLATLNSFLSFFKYPSKSLHILDSCSNTRCHCPNVCAPLSTSLFNA